MKKIAKNWKPLLDHINIVINSPTRDFSAKTKEQAEMIRQFLLNIMLMEPHKLENQNCKSHVMKKNHKWPKATRDFFHHK